MGGTLSTQARKESIVLRSDLSHDPTLAAAAAPQTLVAFSPDIVPLGATDTDLNDVADAYGDFIAHPLQNGMQNKLFVRGWATGKLSDTATTSVTIRSIPNELILWPQVWRGAPSLGASTLQPRGQRQVMVTKEPVMFTPTEARDRHDTLLAIIEQDEGRRASYIAPKNWRELVDTVGEVPSIALYNVLTVEPVVPEIKLKTRLRIFDDELASVPLRISLEGVGLPKRGIEVALDVVDGDGKKVYSIERIPLPPGVNPGVDVLLPPGFDGFVHVHVFHDLEFLVSDYASISVVVTGMRKKGAADVLTLIGAEHIVFDSAITLAKFVEVNAARWADPPFYFRGFIGDGPPPRRTIGTSSPDIQPTGQTPEADPIATLNNFSVDVTTNRRVSIKPNVDNFIYGRITAVRACSGRVRLFAIPSAMILYPTKYHKYTVWDAKFDPDTGRLKDDIGLRGFSANGPAQIVIPGPFDYFQPAAPGDLAPGSNHYCLVLEAAESVDVTNPNATVPWPHEISITTTSTYATWLLNEPRACWRNTSYAFGENKDVQSYRTDFAAPSGATQTDKWYYELQLTNVPVGSQVEVVAVIASANPPTNVPNQLGITRRTVEDPSDSYASAKFVGVGADFHLLLTIIWYPNGKTSGPGMKLEAIPYYRSGATSLLSHVLKRHARPAGPPTDLVVFPDYPLFKPQMRGIRTAREEGFKGIRGAMQAHDAPGVLDAKTAASAPGIVEFVVGGDGMVANV